MVVNRESQLCLDADIRQAKQKSSQHPRIAMQKPNFNALRKPEKTRYHDHLWKVSHLANGEHLIQAMFSTVANKALDGNTNVPQHSPSHPSPFLYPAHPN